MLGRGRVQQIRGDCHQGLPSSSQSHLSKHKQLCLIFGFKKKKERKRENEKKKKREKRNTEERREGKIFLFFSPVFFEKLKTIDGFFLNQRILIAYFIYEQSKLIWASCRAYFDLI